MFMRPLSIKKGSSPLLAVALSLLFCAGACHAVDPRNPYGLDLTNTVREYREQVRENPQTELVDLETVIPGILLDIHYARSDNFTGVPVYTSARAFLVKPAAEALRAVQEALAPRGLCVKIWDAYRPYSVTLYFYEVYRDTAFVANPARGSIHNRGCAVDLTLCSLRDGREIAMPTPFDDFSPVAGADYEDLPPQILANRKLLREVMSRYGFTVNPDEWWHYNFENAKDFPLRDLSFETLSHILAKEKNR